MTKNITLGLLLFAILSAYPLRIFSQNDLTLNLVFDRYRSETSWQLWNTDLDEIVEEGGDYGANFGANGAYPHPPISITGLADGSYEFIMLDEYSDGMCCQYGNGGYTLILDATMETIASGGAFGGAQSTFFALPYVAPPMGCTDPEAVNFDPEAETNDGSCIYLTTPLSINLVPFATGLSNPVAIENAGDERLFVCEQNSGLIKIINENGVVTGTFLNVLNQISTGGERGLLGLAFHPNYAENGYFYLNYTRTGGDTEIARYTVTANPNVADPASKLTILRITQPFSNHNGGDLNFGPDGYLYIGMGDGGSGGDPQNNAQTVTSLLGKMLRIDVDGDDFPADALKNYAIPPTNPFVGSAPADEIWALGVRNPWRFSFDTDMGDLWIGDVGQNAHEEVNFVPASSLGGENYGWRCYEGSFTFNTTGCQDPSVYTFPVWNFDHATYGGCSVIGGNVYRGSEYPLLQGHYITTDYCAGTVFSLKQNALGNWVSTPINSQFAAGFAGFYAFGEDINKELYVARSNGTIYRIEEPCSASIPEITVDGNILTATSGISYQWLESGQLIDGATNQVYEVENTGIYSVVVDAGNGCVIESDTITIVVTGMEDRMAIKAFTISPNPAQSQLNLNLDLNATGVVNIEIIDVAGSLVQQLNTSAAYGRFNQTIDVSSLVNGIYNLKVTINNQAMVKKFVKM
jgi:glucose/arabinose dehydrogenase